MKVLTKDQVLCELAKALDKHLVVAYPSFSTWENAPFLSLDKLVASVPWIKESDHYIQALTDEMVVAVCDSYEEAHAVFHEVYGDDSARDDNLISVYAMIIDANGQIVTENT